MATDTRSKTIKPKRNFLNWAENFEYSRKTEEDIKIDMQKKGMKQKKSEPIIRNSIQIGKKTIYNCSRQDCEYQGRLTTFTVYTSENMLKFEDVGFHSHIFEIDPYKSRAVNAEVMKNPMINPNNIYNTLSVDRKNEILTTDREKVLKKIGKVKSRANLSNVVDVEFFQENNLEIYDKNKIDKSIENNPSYDSVIKVENSVENILGYATDIHRNAINIKKCLELVETTKFSPNENLDDIENKNTEDKISLNHIPITSRTAFSIGSKDNFNENYSTNQTFQLDGISTNTNEKFISQNSIETTKSIIKSLKFSKTVYDEYKLNHTVEKYENKIQDERECYFLFEKDLEFCNRESIQLKRDSNNLPVYEILRQNTLYEEENSNLKKKIIALETQIQHFQEKNSNEEERNPEKVILKPKQPKKFLTLMLSTRFGCFPCSTSNLWGQNTGGIFLKMFISSLDKVRNNVIRNFKNVFFDRIYQKEERKKIYFDIMKDVEMKKIRLLNVFHYRKRYTCPDCCKEIFGKNFHRHIDECKESRFEKTLCNRCLRDCVEATPIFFENKHVYFHSHLCSRPRKKINGGIKYESYLRKKRRWTSGVKAKYVPKVKKDNLSPRFNIFEVAEILHFENVIRESRRYKYYNYAIHAFGNVWKILDFDNKIASLSLHCSGRCCDEKTVKDYFDCCILFKEFVGLNIYHMNRKGSFGFKRRIDLWKNYQYYLNELCSHSKKYAEVKNAWDTLVTEMTRQDDWCKFSENKI